ncbi:MAG: class III signal peptide-containing protein [Nanoarchaeota archaeon]|nr:class III signal peptide-containing protein [Nanoarchaeota archaeon]
MYNKRGQISLEYVMIVGAVLLVTIPLFFYAIYEANNKIRLNQADDAVNTLANAADTVYSLGPGSKKYVWVSIPNGVESQLVSENEIMLVLSIFGGNSDIHASSKAVVVGSVPTGKGTYRIAVEALGAGRVRIGEDYLDVTPPVILRVYPETGEGQVICPGFIVLGADTDEPATCNYNLDTDLDIDDMSSEFDGRGLTHTSTIYVDQDETRVYYARCEDAFGNEMIVGSKIEFDTGVPCGAEGTGGLSGLNLSDDVGPPEVHLISPPDNYMKNYSWVDFEYNVTDTNNSIEFCLLVAEGINYEGNDITYFSWNSQPERNITHNMTVIMEKGNYTWYVNCTDNSTNHNQGQSEEIWDIEVTKTFTESFLNSCAGECGYLGYSDGFCRENPNKCDDIEGGLYLESGDELCKVNLAGDPSRDTCCCIP